MEESCDYCAIRGCEGECRDPERIKRPRRRGCVRETFESRLGANGGGSPLICCTLKDDTKFEVGDGVRKLCAHGCLFL